MKKLGFLLEFIPHLDAGQEWSLPFVMSSPFDFAQNLL